MNLVRHDLSTAFETGLSVFVFVFYETKIDFFFRKNYRSSSKGGRTSVGRYKTWTPQSGPPNGSPSGYLLHLFFFSRPPTPSHVLAFPPSMFSPLFSQSTGYSEYTRKMKATKNRLHCLRSKRSRSSWMKYRAARRSFAFRTRGKWMRKLHLAALNFVRLVRERLLRRQSPACTLGYARFSDYDLVIIWETEYIQNTPLYSDFEFRWIDGHELIPEDHWIVLYALKHSTRPHRQRVRKFHCNTDGETFAWLDGFTTFDSTLSFHAQLYCM